MKFLSSFILALVMAMPLMAQESELIIPTTNGKGIYGIISPAKSVEAKHGVAIISHGFNGSHHFGRDYFATLNELGYSVYSFDFPCGSVRSKSDNNTMEMSILDEVNALLHIVQYFQNQTDVDPSRIVLIGESQGGLVSALAAARVPDQISRLVLIYPALCIPDNWTARYPKVEQIPDTTRLWNVPMGRRFFTELRTLDVYGTIGQYKRPVLIVHGSDDRVVPISYSQRAEQTYGDAKLHVIDKAGHGFKPNERVLSNQYVREFLLDRH
ncbi:MAG: alpha/beta hydrolase [Bacteroidales bacterium]|nr:alpha/beta hydrolase [Bacteroidales bacterium]